MDQRVESTISFRPVLYLRRIVFRPHELCLRADVPGRRNELDLLGSSHLGGLPLPSFSGIPTSFGAFLHVEA